MRLIILICVSFLMAGCASAGVPEKVVKKDESVSMEAAMNSFLSVSSKPQEMILVGITAQYHQKTSKWPEKIDDFKAVFPGFSLNNLSTSNNNQNQSQKTAINNANFTPRESNDLLVKYTNEDGSQGGFYLMPPIGSNSYQFCFIVDSAKECSNFLPFSMTMNEGQKDSNKRLSDAILLNVSAPDKEEVKKLLDEKLK